MIIIINIITKKLKDFIPRNEEIKKMNKYTHYRTSRFLYKIVFGYKL